MDLVRPWKTAVSASVRRRVVVQGWTIMKAKLLLFIHVEMNKSYFCLNLD